ncbi:hypothetical protein DBV05_g8593 [Lasiodiplodia theobromae]|uniref:Uncharacterized protein n=1 Tax=Lasiodiplodia theobromae TaxID=45133 RepID=A0A5N5D5T8_9PEZI|nr:hypothetical protein DBV05_g8593 [Lasiodiplodia theobromae]
MSSSSSSCRNPSGQEGHGSASPSQAPASPSTPLPFNNVNDNNANTNVDDEEHRHQCHGTCPDSGGQRCRNLIDAHAWKADSVRFCNLHEEQAADALARARREAQRLAGDDANLRVAVAAFLDRKMTTMAFLGERAAAAATKEGEEEEEVMAEKEKDDDDEAREEEEEEAIIRDEQWRQHDRELHLSVARAHVSRQLEANARACEEAAREIAELRAAAREEARDVVDAVRAGRLAGRLERVEGELADSHDETNATLRAEVRASQNRIAALETEVRAADAERERLAVQLSDTEVELGSAREAHTDIAAQLANTTATNRELRARVLLVIYTMRLIIIGRRSIAAAERAITERAAAERAAAANESRAASRATLALIIAGFMYLGRRRG